LECASACEAAATASLFVTPPQPVSVEAGLIDSDAYFMCLLCCGEVNLLAYNPWTLSRDQVMAGFGSSHITLMLFVLGLGGGVDYQGNVRKRPKKECNASTL